MSNHSIICKNCENTFNGHYCNNCGQKAAIHRINGKHLLHELFHAFTHLDRGFLFTAKAMIIRPGHAIREYLHGKRVEYPNPLLMLLIIGGLCSLVYYQFEIKLISSFKISDLDGGLHAIDSKFFALLFVGYSLIISFFDFFIFRYKGYNYTELFTLNVFTSSEILLTQLCLVPLWLFGKDLGINNYLRAIIGLLFMAYLVYVRYQFFEVRGDRKALKKLWLTAFVLLILFFAFSWKTIYQIYTSI